MNIGGLPALGIETESPEPCAPFGGLGARSEDLE